MNGNLWADHANALADAYVRDAGTVRFEVVTRSLQPHMRSRMRVVDVGGGYGLQAIMLARAGHTVTVIDFDPKMLEIARNKLFNETASVSSRVDLVLGDAWDAAIVVGTEFDLVCCHSVLMYEHDPTPMLKNIIGLVRRGGLISVLCLNQDAIAMRSGLQGRWQEAIASMESDQHQESQYVACRAHIRREVSAIIEATGARIREWHGVGVFTDHLREKIIVDDPEDVYRAEWLAGKRDPYRQVARCFHIIAER